MDSVHALRHAFHEVPDVLLNSDCQAVLRDALVSLDVIDDGISGDALVVFVGPSGSGRSFVFNRFVGMAASAEGLIRPTTLQPVVSGSRPHTLRDFDGRFVVAPDAPSGLVCIDTPSWEHQPEGVMSALVHADRVVVVVSPGRYADASVASLWSEVSDRDALVVLNRAPVDSMDLANLVTSVRAVFNVEPLVVPEGATDGAHLRDELAAGVAANPERSSKAIMARSAISAARYIAGAVTKGGGEIGVVRDAVGRMVGIDRAMAGLSVHDTWVATRQALLDKVAKHIRDSDNDVVATCASPFARQILERLGPWDDSALRHDLDVWRDRCSVHHCEAASIRWRRGSAEQLIDHLSWKSAINGDVVLPRRYLRTMGKHRLGVVTSARDDLLGVVSGFVEGRRVAWLDTLTEIGQYQPGALLAAAELLNVDWQLDA